MRLLLVEDETEVTESLLKAATAQGILIDVVVADSHETAMVEVAAASHFDLIVTDLKIPSKSGALDASTDYGRDVYATARRERPGTPIWVFSGFADEDFLEAIIEDARQGDPFGSGYTQAMIRSFRKIHLHKLLEELSAGHGHIASLESIELSTGGVDLQLDDEARRLLRLLARKAHGTTARIEAIDTGLSSSRTLHVRIIDGHGGQVAETIVKIGPRADLEEEARRYEENVPLALTATCFAPIWTVVTDGAGRAIALAYTVAVPDPRSLGALLAEDQNAAVAALSQLRAAEDPWYAARHVEQLTLYELSTLLSAPPVPEGVLGLTGPDQLRLMGLTIQVHHAPQHGDLHLENVLVDSAGNPVLIDYGRTGPRIAAYDPISLELCFAFHPGGRVLANGWPSTDQAARFDELEFYLEGCPYPDFIRKCRGWAHNVANGDREVWAAVFAYSVRQLPYSDTSDELAVAFARRAADLLLS